MSPAADDSIRSYVRQVLADGEAHNSNWVVVEVGKLIPPGIAIRQAEKERRLDARRAGRPEPAPLTDTHQAQHWGIRSLVTKCLGSMAREGLLLVTQHGATRRWVGEHAADVQLPVSALELWRIQRMADALGWTPGALRERIKAGGSRLTVVQTTTGMRLPAAEIHAWALELGTSRNSGKPTIKWTAYDQDWDALVDIRVKAWVRLDDGELVLRKADPMRAAKKVTSDEGLPDSGE